MFTSDFYPTPDHVIEMMTIGLDLTGKTVLEPSAGSGKIVDFLKRIGTNVIACELHPELQLIIGQKCRLIKPNFFDLTKEEVSHVDYIIMNPPFSNADKHILHAWEIAPEECQIIALCNIETIKNHFSENRSKLYEIIDKNGGWSSIGNAFDHADRTTNIEVAMIKVFKPGTGESEFAGYFFDMNEEQENVVSGTGIMKHNDIREIVNRYVAAVKMFDSVDDASQQINSLINPISNNLGIAFGAHSNDHETRNLIITRDVFKKELQKSAWRSIFDKMNMRKYVTSGVMEDINKFVEQQQNVPFTMTNIYKMIEIIFGTHAGRMDRVLVETFDYICSLSADNSEAGEKWKTNSNYKVNRRFIMNRITEIGWSGEMKVRYSAEKEIDDIIKALCYMTGKDYDDQISISLWFDYPYKIKCDGKILMGYDNHNRNGDDWSFTNKVNNLKEAGHEVEVIKVENRFGEWVDWGFFRVRGYKKGTMHFEFKDENVWMEFNRRVAKIKGWAIPQKTDKKKKGTERAKANGVELFTY